MEKILENFYVENCKKLENGEIKKPNENNFIATLFKNIPRNFKQIPN